MKETYLSCVREYIKRQELSGQVPDSHSVLGRETLLVRCSEAVLLLPRLFDQISGLRLVGMALYECNVVGTYTIASDGAVLVEGPLAAGISIPVKINLVPVVAHNKALYDPVEVRLRFPHIAVATVTLEYIGTVFSAENRKPWYGEPLVGH
jgi:hypothetical protein